MASKVDIANRALQKLGARRIVSLDEDSVNARAVKACFESVKEAELEEHPWSFAIKRAQLAASSTSPLFTKANSFPLPSDFLRLLDPDPEDNFNTIDWQIEGRNIVTNEAAALEIRYIYNVTDPNEMTPLFREALSMRIAFELSEELTQSNTKEKNARAAYESALLKAKRTNAMQRRPQEPALDEWQTVRL